MSVVGFDFVICEREIVESQELPQQWYLGQHLKIAELPIFTGATLINHGGKE